MGGVIEQDTVDSLKELYPFLRDIHAVDKETGENVPFYNPERIAEKLSLYPNYVVNATLEGFRDQRISIDHYKAILDKWGKKDPETKRYSETIPMVFYRTARLVANGMKEKDGSINEEEKTREIFQRFERSEMFTNTPYMANGGHSLLTGELVQKLDAIQYSKGRTSNEEVLSAVRNDIVQGGNIQKQLFACFVLDMYDSRRSIFSTMFEAVNIQAATGGTGFNFSHLRPANETIHKTGGTTDGPISFMAAYSHVLGKTINQSGKREGANMFMLDWDHPDIIRFLYSKRKDGEIPAANISVAIDHGFMQAVQSDGEERFYPLKNPHHNPKLRPHIPRHYTVDQIRQAEDIERVNKKTIVSLRLSEDGKEVLSPWLPKEMDEEYRVIGKVGEDGIVYLDSKKVLRHLAFGAWSTGEPGIIITGHINDHNPTHPRHYRNFLREQTDPEAMEIVRELSERYAETSIDDLLDTYVSEKDADGRPKNLPVGVGEIRATNPCGEKPLLGNEACVLGHINLEKILRRDDSAPSGYVVDRGKFEEDTRLMVGILDNAIDQNDFTNPQIEETQKSNRKIGLGFMGLANLLYRLELPYNSQETRDFVDDLLGFWEEVSDDESFLRGEEFGAFPNFKYSHHRDGKPKRNAIVRTLAPTGTTGFAAQTTGGMEPEYALAYTRTTVQGTSIEIFNPVLEEKLEKYPFLRNDNEREEFHKVVAQKGSLQEFTINREDGETEGNFLERQKNLRDIKRIFVTTYDILPEEHLRMQAVVQSHTDDSISKTTNFRSNATVEDVENAFILAYNLGIKGLTFYRDGARKDQPLQVGGSLLEDKLEDRRKLTRMVSDVLKRERPETVGGLTERTKTPFGNAYITLSWERDENGRDVAPFETFVSIGKTGGDLQSLAEALARSISLGLQGGIPVEGYIKQFEGIGGETQVGIGEERVRSFPDALANALRVALQKETKFMGDGEPDLDSKKNGSSGNFCPSCGYGLNFVEGCETCISCGFSRC